MAATDPQVLALAAQVTESKEQDIPLLLLKLKGILSNPSLGCEESKKIKQDIYDYGLTQYCLLVLKRDHSQLRGAWATAAQLAEILSHCCVGLEIKEDPEEFYKKFLPSAIDSMLVLGKRLQARFIRAIKFLQFHQPHLEIWWSLVSRFLRHTNLPMTSSRSP